MKISIITATFNSKKNISDCLQSVVKQTYKNIEHIFVDGGSADGTLHKIKEYQKQHPCVYYVSEPDKGIYDALNKGIKMATGDVIGFLHSDDLFASKTVISEIIKTFENYKVDGVYGDLEYVDKNDINKVVRHWKSESFSKGLLEKGWMPAHPTLFLRKEVYQKHGLFNLNYQIAADYDLMLRILLDPSLQFKYIHQIITKMRMGGASNKSLKNLLQKSKEDLEIMRKHEIGGIHTLIGKNLSKINQFFNILLVIYPEKGIVKPLMKT